MPSAVPAETRFQGWVARASFPESPAHVRGLALLCVAIAAVLALASISPIAPEGDQARNVRAIPLMMAAGLACWLLANRFRVWMLHAAFTLVIAGVLYRLLTMETSLGAAMVLSVLVWCCVLTGAVNRPGIARAYFGFIMLGSVAVLLAGSMEMPVGLWASFAISFGVTAETLSRLGTRLREEGVTDSLTGLRNRKGLAEGGALAIAIARRSGKPLTVAQIDLDGFKWVNDEHGHAAGDAILRRCSEAWRGEIRSGDVLGRAGGDEFTLVMPGSDAAAARTLLERLELVSPAAWSVGLTELKDDDDFEACVARADRALLETKAERSPGSGRGAGSSPAANLGRGTGKAAPAR